MASKIEFRKLAKSPNFDIIVEEGRFEIELDQYGNPKSLIKSGSDHRLNFGTNPIAKKYADDIRDYTRKNKENFKAYWDDRVKNTYATGGGIEYDLIEKWLISSGREYDDWNWNGSTLTLIKYEDDSREKITKEELIEEGVFSEKYATGGGVESQDIQKWFNYSYLRLAREKGDNFVNDRSVEKKMWDFAHKEYDAKLSNTENYKKLLEKIRQYATGGGVGSKSAKKIKIESYLPVFTGFYNTIFEPNEEMYIEDGYDYDDYDFDYKKYNEDMGEACSDAIEEQLEEFEVKVKFQSVSSPREYNFGNDSFNVEYTVTPSGIAKITSYLKKNRGAFEQYLKDNYTSRSGFMSSYSNDADDWFEDLKNAKKIEHIFGSVLEFILQNEGYDQNDLYDDVYDKVWLDGGLKEGVANNQEFIEEYASDNYRNKTSDEVISDIISKFEDEGTDYDESKVREIVYGYYNRVGDQSLSLFRNGGAVKISNREARSYVQNRTPFRANNLSGENFGDIYVVKSYGYYPIFVYKDGVWYENSNKYSSSTAKQMGQSRPSADTVKVSKGEIEGMYADGGNLASGWNYSIGGL